MASFLVTIPEDFLNIIDKSAKKRMISRSKFIRDAFEFYTRKKAFKKNVKRDNDARILEEILS